MGTPISSMKAPPLELFYLEENPQWNSLKGVILNGKIELNWGSPSLSSSSSSFWGSSSSCVCVCIEASPLCACVYWGSSCVCVSFSLCVCVCVSVFVLQKFSDMESSLCPQCHLTFRTFHNGSPEEDFEQLSQFLDPKGCLQKFSDMESSLCLGTELLSCK